MAQTTLRMCKAVRIPHGETNPDYYYIKGDILGIHVFGIQPTERERKAYAWVRITDIPNGVAKKAKKWLERSEWTSTPPYKKLRRKIIHIDIDLLKAEYPGLSDGIDKLFDPEFTLPLAAIPEFTWAKFKNALWDKVNVRVVPDLQWAIDAPAKPYEE